MGKILKEIKETETESVAEILKNPATEPVSEPETPKVDTELDTKVDTEVEHEPVIKPKKTKQPAPKQSDADKLLELHKQKEQLKKDIKDFDNSRKAVMNYKEAKEHRKELQKRRNEVSEIRQQIFELRRKLHVEKKAQSKLSGVALKQSKFMSLYKQGLSISNITRHPDGVKKESLESIMTPDFVREIDKMDKRFIPMWLRWKQKFLPKKD